MATLLLDAETSTFFPVADTTIYSESGSQNGGGGNELFAGTTGPGGGNSERRALLRFDLSSIPSGSTIDSAALELAVTRAARGSGNVSYAVHRLTRSWGEGNAFGTGQNGGSATTGSATWTQAMFGSEDWTRSGADFDNSASATTTVGISGTATWSGSGLVADIQEWIDGSAANHGWIVRVNESGNQNARAFSSRESGGPVLTITYTEPTQTPQTITFDPPTSRILGEGPVMLGATASSGLAVSYAVVSGPGSIDGDELSFTGSGSVLVEATQAGNDDFEAADPVQRTIEVKTLLADWLDTHFTEDEQGMAAVSGDDADPDHDGLPNLIEFALQFDPRAPSAIDLDDVEVTAGGDLILEFPRDTRFRTIDLFLETNATLDPAGWSPVVTASAGQTPTGSAFDGETVEGNFTRLVGVRIAISGSERMFLRLRAARVPGS